eukprot:CAMPEP_0179406752 /NCGR_PEP_ID=MMETSP0799-20121207/1090_1 /TAXON_ID=46947 /ORGANISM="Geminigera cryophila, Strain CCMP2564" /LENGTH=147 /DNA_ID=CAMNT_0021177893 /DNA_START=47 /DNA_END=490 /DNA_ORIENTATION=-
MSPAPILAGAQNVSEASDAEVAASQSWGNMPAGKLALVLLQSVGVFAVAGVFEIGGGWLVWGSIRDGKPYWWGIIGGILLAGYGVVATAQPSGLDFGRIYAAYGGYFILLSLLWGVYVDKSLVMDTGDFLGCLLALGSAGCICLWPR